MKISFVSLLSVVLFMGGCGGDQPSTPPQAWEDLSFIVETRPPELSPGMIEFLVVANRGERKRAHDLLVSIRMGQMGRWTQAIQDGHTGVYRRAIRVSDPKTDILNVHVKYKDKETVLMFPLASLLVNKTTE